MDTEHIEPVPSTHIIPTFCPSSSLTPTSTSTGGNDALVGIAIHFDSIQGHIGCYMTSSGVAASINLSSHVQYCESQIDFQVRECDSLIYEYSICVCVCIFTYHVAMC